MPLQKNNAGDDRACPCTHNHPGSAHQDAAPFTEPCQQGWSECVAAQHLLSDLPPRLIRSRMPAIRAANHTATDAPIVPARAAQVHNISTSSPSARSHTCGEAEPPRHPGSPLYSELYRSSPPIRERLVGQPFPEKVGPSHQALYLASSWFHGPFC
eukprot:1751939-Amphidinium_carterae.1